MNNRYKKQQCYLGAFVFKFSQTAEELVVHDIACLREITGLNYFSIEINFNNL
jgi:hypothetical protein